MGFVLPHPHPAQLRHINDLTPDINMVFPYYAQMNKKKKKTTRKEGGRDKVEETKWKRQSGRDKVEGTKWEKTEVQL